MTLDDKDTPNLAQPLYPSETLYPSDTLYPPLVSDISNMIKVVDTQRDLLALNEELKQQNITPGELATILKNCRNRNIHVRDLVKMLRKAAQLTTGFGIIGFKLFDGKAKRVVKQETDDSEEMTRRKREHD
jgi:hypothetical protein